MDDNVWGVHGGLLERLAGGPISWEACEVPGDIAADHGVRQDVHPHVATLVETADDPDRIPAGSDVPICLDTAHVTLGGADALELADRAAGRVGLVHLEDVRLAVAARLHAGELALVAAFQVGLFAPLGDGDVPVADVITTLERHGYDGLYALESDMAINGGEPPAGEGPVRDVAKSVAYVRSLAPALSATLRAGAGPGSPASTEHQRGTQP